MIELTCVRTVAIYCYLYFTVTQRKSWRSKSRTRLKVRSYIEQHEIECEEFRGGANLPHFLDRLILLPSVKKSLDEVRQRIAGIFRNAYNTLDSVQDLEQIKVQPGCKYAVKNHGAASLSPYKYVSWIIRKLVQSGQLNLQTNTPVLSISEFNNNESTPSARFSLVTPRGTVSARNVLLASNAYIHLTCSRNSRT